MSFELPATLSIRVWHPNFVYGGAVIFFGLCALLTSEARNYASVMVLRLFLGFGESFIQTGFVYLSLWYSSRELTTRCGMLFNICALTGAILTLFFSILVWSNTCSRNVLGSHCIRGPEEP